MSEDTEVGSIFVSNYPPYSFWSSDNLSAAFEALASPPPGDAPLGLYVHIPFCRKRCHFCYFRIYTDKDGKQIATYLDALAREVELYAEQPAIRNRRLSFVYIGGGTPSFISVERLRALVARLTAAIPWTGAEEVTFECEPGTLSRPKLAAIREIGVTRLSLGIENFDDEILRLNGRAHLSDEIMRVRSWIEELDFPQLNVDLIAGMLGETWDTWRDSVQKTIDYDPDSVTVYQLELPYNTTFTKELQDGRLETPVADWETKRAWNEHAFGELEKAGYELSSAYTMVKKDQRSAFVYRNSLWHGADMIGSGVASFSHLSGVHFQNLDRWGEYLERLERGQLPLGRAFATTERERLTRELILQLKLGRLPLGGLRQKFGVDVESEYRDVLSKLERDEMLTVDSGEVRLTRAGLMRVDSLLPEFYDLKYQNARYT